jgi:hypothetical protein
MQKIFRLTNVSDSYGFCGFRYSGKVPQDDGFRQADIGTGGVLPDYNSLLIDSEFSGKRK